MQCRLIEPALSGDFGTLMGWADERRRMGVRANAETPPDAETARKFGAEGIGLLPDRTHVLRCRAHPGGSPDDPGQYEAGRRTALARLLPFQREDFSQLFKIMAGLPVTIRLLDPPLHEFLPHDDQEMQKSRTVLATDIGTIRKRAEELAEANPMLGHRGCRLGISFPEMYEMQARAIFEGAIMSPRKPARRRIPEIMIPLVGMTEGT